MFGILLLLLVPPVVLLLIVVIILATFGKSLGIREFYADVLLRIFEWGSSAYPINEIEYETDETLEGTTRLRRSSSSDIGTLIVREKSEALESKLYGNEIEPGNQKTVRVIVNDSLDFITEWKAIIEDQVTSRFKAEQLPSWNLLTRTRFSFQYISWKLTTLWVGGFFLRYFVLVPLRTAVFGVGFFMMVITCFTIGLIPHQGTRKWLYRHAMLMSMRIVARSFSSIIRYHDQENRADRGGICVANHTSPIDVLILSTDNCYAMIGQKQGGILGFMQTALSRGEHHIWFERSEANDRKQVTERLKEHTNDESKLPIIIFPEGTCINNTGVMMFKKGSFEIGSTIYPIAMKYDSRLTDAFWNSSEQSYGEYLWRMMTSWAIICDIWYLPKMTKQEGEDAIAFARRVKRAIAQKGGLVDLEWDGMLKRERVSSKLVQLHQKRYFERLQRTTSINTIGEEQSEALQLMQQMTEEERSLLLKELDDTMDEATLVKKVNEYGPVVRKRLQSSTASNHSQLSNPGEKKDL
ncbi:unnamed protein product, partial [Mesorhabditis belari]|uniref:Phospholipid/glycerol acyltransferase domain-containing protein n=1 Tax=Mesorhabditis belari TaxID=2138241 RepID=A0AAF3ENQ2_9BILA